MEEQVADLDFVGPHSQLALKIRKKMAKDKTPLTAEEQVLMEKLNARATEVDSDDCT